MLEMSSKPPSLTSSMTSFNANATPRCSTHRKGFKFFCCNHELLLCSVCAVKRHRTCDEVLTISEACDDKKSEGKKLCDLYSQRIVLLENAIVERKAAKKLLDTNAQEIQNEIHEVTQRLIDLVKHEERTLLISLQEMQSKEADTLEKDISGLETTNNIVKHSQQTIVQSLKLSEIDLIHAVIKEKQHAEEESDVETIVKKRFREVDFKFIVSPHVTSFLKHFKVLGQVMLSEESGTRNISNSLSSVQSETVSMRPKEPVSRKQPTVPSDEDVLSARERWVRDRQLQMQRNSQGQEANRYSTTRGNYFQFPSTSDDLSLNPERKNRPMRALPRPETPEVYSRPTSQSARREFIARPMSTPPTESQTHTGGPKSKDVARFTQNHYHYVKAEPISFTERNPSPSPLTTQYADQNDLQNGRNENDQVHVYGRRSSQNLHPDEKPRSKSPAPIHTAGFALVNIEDKDVNFGRSFAAVQITDGRRLPIYQRDEGKQEGKTFSPRSRTPVYDGQTRSPPMDNQNGSTHNNPPPSYRRPLVRNGQRDQSVSETNKAAYQRDQSVSETNKSAYQIGISSTATDEEKGRRWVQQAAFTSSGIGSKRLISGIGALPDGRIVLVDQEHYTIQLYDRNYRFIAEAKLDSRPFDIAVLNENKIVVSLQSDRVLKFYIVTNDSLTPVADLGVPCDMVCYGICRGNGTYCVCCGDEVWILSDEGRVLNRIKSDKSGNAIFGNAEYIEIDRNSGILFVSDAGNNKVIALQTDGSRLWEFTYVGFKPCGLFLLDHYLYVCDRDQHRVLVLNLDGQVVSQSIIGRLDNPRAICFNPAANTLYVTQMRYDAIVSPSKPIHVYTMQ